jgi:hypothetical protein
LRSFGLRRETRGSWLVGVAFRMMRAMSTQMSEVERLRAALQEITEVEPTSDTSRLGVVEWANALDRAQLIARNALEVSP